MKRSIVNVFSKINFFRLSVYILIACLLTCTVLSETLAKYQSKYLSVDYAVAAAWSFEVQDVEITEVNTFTVDVFNSSRIYDENTTVSDADAPSSGQRNGNTVPLIVPGTSGSFDLKLENLSDVYAQCDILLETSFASGINFNYKFAPGDNFSATNTKQIIIPHNTNQTLTIFWQWPFNGNDNADNVVREGNTPCTITVTVSAKQLAQ